MASDCIDLIDTDSPAALILADRFEAIRANELSARHWSHWHALRAANPQLTSPYFHPAFTQIAARVRPETEVLLLHAQGECVGYLPFHRVRQDWAVPIGGRLNDYQGIIAKQPVLFDSHRMLVDNGLTRWEFHSWLWPKPEFRACVYARPITSSRAHWTVLDDYLTRLRQSSSTIRRHGQKRRRLEREHGPLRLELDETNPSVLDWLIRVKRDKYARTSCTDYFAPAWCRQLIEEVFAARQPGFRGILSVLYAGKRPIAGHFGMVANETLHYWFPVYDPSYHRYSVGTELYLRIVECAGAWGIRQIDFGYGTEPYKRRLLTDTDCVWTGAFDSHALRRRWHSAWDGLSAQIKRSVFRQIVKRICRSMFPDLGKPVIR